MSSQPGNSKKTVTSVAPARYSQVTNGPPAIGGSGQARRQAGVREGGPRPRTERGEIDVHKIMGWLLATVVPLAGGQAILSVGPAAATTAATASSAPAGAAPNWTSLLQAALQATAAYRGSGPLTASGPAGAVALSAVTTAAGTITVAQRTVEATDGSGTVLLQLVFLGGTQLVVDETSPSDGFRGATLVLEPGSSVVAGVYPLPGTVPTTATDAATSIPSRRSHRRATATDAVLTTTTRDRHQPRARLVTVGGCYGDPQTPGVIGSMYGPLVQGEGVVDCGVSEDMSVIVSLYQGSTHVGTTAGGSATGDYLGVNAYYGCTTITGTNSFHTAELWAINGNLQGGDTSSSANLHCA